MKETKRMWGNVPDALSAFLLWRRLCPQPWGLGPVCPLSFSASFSSVCSSDLLLLEFLFEAHLRPQCHLLVLALGYPLPVFFSVL